MVKFRLLLSVLLVSSGAEILEGIRLLVLFCPFRGPLI
jgi:hypothetical protein